MLRKRIIPVLLLKDGSLVKTRKFKKPVYVGDPCNTARIFNEFEVDELMVLDISAGRAKRNPDYKLLKELASECFMPLGYGGGITNIAQAEKIFLLGYEKVVVNTAALDNCNFISQLASRFGSQAIVVSIDVKKGMFGKYYVRHGSSVLHKALSPSEWVKKVCELGAGEILITSVDREGTWEGFDIELIDELSDSVSIPVIAHGGAGSYQHIQSAFESGVDAVAVGSMVVFQKKDSGVLVHYEGTF